ncbi:aldo/keto reductase, partial [Myxococcota bacterium]|nr:aldo/keto reductase [Myxococcota bacterium]
MAHELLLKSGDALPVIGLGLWKIDPAETASVVAQAVDLGYRHFDSACDYGNEKEAGEGLRGAMASGACRREDLWVTSKLWNTYHAEEHVRAACERSLADLGLDYLDLYLIHFPIAQKYVP